MPTNYTAIATNAAANASVFNAPLTQVHTVIGDPSTMGVTNKDNLAEAIGATTLRTSSKGDLTTAINSALCGERGGRNRRGAQ